MQNESDKQLGKAFATCQRLQSTVVSRNKEINQLRGVVTDAYNAGYKKGYVTGAVDYGGIVVRPEDVEVPEGKGYGC